MHHRLIAAATGLALACAAPAALGASPAAEGELAARVAQLAAHVQAAEDLRAIKRLQRTYGYFLDKGMWTDLAEYYTDDAVTNYPAGVYIGKPSITKHLYLNVGGVKMGEVGLGDNRLYNHMNIQPVVHLDPGGQTGKGRWRAFAMFGSYGGGATWAEGVYEMTYAKVDGVWKIKTLDYHSGFGAPYTTGWGVTPPGAAPAASNPDAAVGPAAAPARQRRQLPHPADRERNMACEGFPAACIAPFHYGNPGTTDGGHAWTSLAVPAPSSADLKARVAELAHRATLLRDEQKVENLQRIYGFYFERQQWDQVADLLANDGTMELGLQGVYVGKRRVREFLGSLGRHGLSDGVMSERFQLQPVVSVAPDGRTARVRSRELGLTGAYGQGGQWSEGIYENAFVKQDGVWKLKSVRFYPTFISDYDKGWAKDAQPPRTVSTTLPPDRPPSETYQIFPKAHVPPFHYVNPMTGRAPTYPAPARGGPEKPLPAASLAGTEAFGGSKTKVPAVRNIEAALAQAEKDVARVKDYHEIENLESAYGYYLDKNLWTDLANLFARDGSMELAQRGIYKGQPRVREFLFAVFGRSGEGPVAGRLGNHVQMQSVIHVAEDGSTAQIRQRMMQQMGQNGRASMGGAIYENAAVKEDGVWKFSKVHAYNTFTAGYDGGWAKNPGRGVPGPSRELPPDAPPTMQFGMFPTVYQIPYHYPNPVTGRTELPAIEKVAIAMPEPPARVAAAPVEGQAPSPSGAAAAVPAGMPAEVATALREIGPRIDGQRTSALYAPLAPKEPYANVAVHRDVAYGPHERHVLDVFAPAGAVAAGGARTTAAAPIVVFIHGGGFSRGAKRAPGSPFYDNVGVWAAKNGLVGVTINYRLAPQFQYPSGVEDLTRLIAWLKTNAAKYGANPSSIFLWGHSAGAAHAADYVARTASPGIAGAILTSGIYDVADGDKVSIWKDYYGEDVTKYKERSSVPGLVKTNVPLLVTWAELDPPNFVVDTEKLVKARADAGRPVKTVFLPGHSHISETYAVGTGDESLSRPVLEFIRAGAPAR